MIYANNSVSKSDTDKNIQCVCAQIQANIDDIMLKQGAMNEHEKFENLHKVKELKQILSTIKDLDQSLNTLLGQ